MPSQVTNKILIEFIFFLQKKNYTISQFVTFTSHLINDKFALHIFLERFMVDVDLAIESSSALIPILGVLVAIIIPVSVFIRQYLESKDKNKTILEISKNIENPSKVADLIDMLDERKKEPIDYRRTGVITLFTGVGLFLFGLFFLGSVLKGVGALIAAVGLGQIVAGYLYPNTSEELTNAVEKFEK